tara:strand:- start:991 stop:1491 length:501 start_codon:yes stop_codon:yes gene_type:complete
MNRKKEIFTEEAKRLYGITPYSVRNYSNFKDGSITRVFEWFTESWGFDHKRKEIIEIVEVDSVFADRGVLATLKGFAKENEEMATLNEEAGFTSIALVRRLFEEPAGEFEEHRDYIYFDLEGNLESELFHVPKDFLKEIEENKEWLGKVGVGEYNRERGTHLSYWS